MLAAIAAPAGGVYTEAPHDYTVTAPADCTVRAKSPKVHAFIACGNGYARVVQAPGTGQPALQRLVNSVISDWSGLRLRENHLAGSLGGTPARTIVADGIAPGHADARIEMVAVTHRGSWYMLVFAAPAGDWDADSATYLTEIRLSFRFLR